MHISEIVDRSNFQYNGETDDGNVEFFITICEDSFVIDYFNKSIEDMNEAHLESLYCESELLEEAIADAKQYILD